MLNYFYSFNSYFNSARKSITCHKEFQSEILHGHSFNIEVRKLLSNNKDNVEQIRNKLNLICKKIDYSFLNDLIINPNDFNIAKFFKENFAYKCPFQINIQPSNDRGIIYMNEKVSYYWRRFIFNAAHFLPNVPKGHKCASLHGHSFEVQIVTKGDWNQDLEYKKIEEKYIKLFGFLNSSFLNEIPGLENPTSENLAFWMWKKLKKEYASLHLIIIKETKNSGVKYDGKKISIWKKFSFESALINKNFVTKKNVLSGISLNLILHAEGNINNRYGWVMDFSELKKLFAQVYEMIDHKPLHNIKSLTKNDLITIGDWIFKKTKKKIINLYRLDLVDNEKNGVMILDTSDSS